MNKNFVLRCELKAQAATSIRSPLGGVIMRGVLYVASLIALVATSVPGKSQSPFPPPPVPATPAPSDNAPPPSSPAKRKAATPAGPNIVGNWSGELNQVGNTTSYKFELSITAKGAETKYLDLDCAGKLTRIG